MPRREPKSFTLIRRPHESNSGLYLLTIGLGSPATVKIGALGSIRFPAGYYAYCGSAVKCLAQRLARHRRKRKKLHWHIDYLTHRDDVTVGDAMMFPFECGGGECRLNRLVQKLFARSVVPGFGCSDCDCSSHLSYLGDGRPYFLIDPELIHATA